MVVNVDMYGNLVGYCTSCGRAAELGGDCCEDGDVVECDESVKVCRDCGARTERVDHEPFCALAGDEPIGAGHG